MSGPLDGDRGTGAESTASTRPTRLSGPQTQQLQQSRPQQHQSQHQLQHRHQRQMLNLSSSPNARGTGTASSSEGPSTQDPANYSTGNQGNVGSRIESHQSTWCRGADIQEGQSAMHGSGATRQISTLNLLSDQHQHRQRNRQHQPQKQCYQSDHNHRDSSAPLENHDYAYQRVQPTGFNHARTPRQTSADKRGHGTEHEDDTKGSRHSSMPLSSSGGNSERISLPEAPNAHRSEESLVGGAINRDRRPKDSDRGHHPDWGSSIQSYTRANHQRQHNQYHYLQPHNRSKPTEGHVSAHEKLQSTLERQQDARATDSIDDCGLPSSQERRDHEFRSARTVETGHEHDLHIQHHQNLTRSHSSPQDAAPLNQRNVRSTDQSNREYRHPLWHEGQYQPDISTQQPSEEHTQSTPLHNRPSPSMLEHDNEEYSTQHRRLRPDEQPNKHHQHQFQHYKQHHQHQRLFQGSKVVPTQAPLDIHRHGVREMVKHQGNQGTFHNAPKKPGYECASQQQQNSNWLEADQLPHQHSQLHAQIPQQSIDHSQREAPQGIIIGPATSVNASDGNEGHMASSRYTPQDMRMSQRSFSGSERHSIQHSMVSDGSRPDTGPGTIQRANRVQTGTPVIKFVANHYKTGPDISNVGCGTENNGGQGPYRRKEREGVDTDSDDVAKEKKGERDKERLNVRLKGVGEEENHVVQVEGGSHDDRFGSPAPLTGFGSHMVSRTQLSGESLSLGVRTDSRWRENSSSSPTESSAGAFSPGSMPENVPLSERGVGMQRGYLRKRSRRNADGTWGKDPGVISLQIGPKQDQTVKLMDESATEASDRLLVSQQTSTVSSSIDTHNESQLNSNPIPKRAAKSVVSTIAPINMASRRTNRSTGMSFNRLFCKVSLNTIVLHALHRFG
ncbi:hypothetical protein BC939DRAFT_316859 [Gamsiella multidivaricata]|uniref:uncharacterized protein n=1 Tax=Gamsiella multidivaricata TaxID=101098 RepID=UPI00221E7275|nr:uncharacterized protein BC939DRAFT_316859 [Gamsiella multidivaricata]KAI7817708.1 hypothetical protein BC939DRAFT_316859 [Gamsiella multidivaricata]